MSLLSKATKGKSVRPVFALIFGPPGVGKSSWAAGAPSPVFLETEDGTAHLNVTRLPKVKKYEEVLQIINELKTEKHDFKTLAIDTLDWLEPLIWTYVCEKNGWANIESPGYGKGYIAANDEWRNLMKLLYSLREEKGMNVIMLAHSVVKAHHDPSQLNPYDRYKLKLNEKAAAVCTEAVDLVGFATYEIFTKTEKGAKKSKAFGDGRRVLYTSYRPSFDAKNRLGLPHELSLSWDDFKEALSADDSTKIAVLLKEIAEVGEHPKLAEKKESLKKAVEAAAKDLAKLQNILNYARNLAGEE